jgi:hypothetical protein
MDFSTKDDFAKRELSIGELETVAAGSIWPVIFGGPFGGGHGPVVLPPWHPGGHGPVVLPPHRPFPIYFR